MNKNQKKVTIIGLSIIAVAFLFYYFAIYPQTKAYSIPSPPGFTCDQTVDKQVPFTSTTDTMQIGGSCNPTSVIQLFSCSDSSCSNIQKFGEQVKLNGVNPSFSGLGTGNLYTYYCYDCVSSGGGTTQSCSQLGGSLSQTNSCSSLDTSSTVYNSIPYSNSQIGTLCCVGSPRPISCLDTDNGYVINQKGTLTYQNNPLIDNCYGTSLDEYVCANQFTPSVGTGGVISVTSIGDTYPDGGYKVVRVNCASFINGVCSNGICTTQTPICTESWSCSNWENCVSNSQHRLCQDNNNCGTTTNKPQETQTCISGVVCGNGVCESSETPTSCSSDCQQVCLQVITKVCNPTTKEIKDYPNSCIPQGWSTNLELCKTTLPTTTFWDKIKEWFSNQTNQIITAVVVVIIGIGGVFYFTSGRKK